MYEEMVYRTYYPRSIKTYIGLVSGVPLEGEGEIPLPDPIMPIESIIEEIESIKQKAQNDFNNFSEDIILLRAVERDLEIICI
jgi:hypothetical protein